MKSGWVTKKLGEVCEDSIRRLKEIDDSRFLYIDISSIDRVRKTVIGATEYDRTSAPGRAQQVVEAGDVLVSTVRPNLNAVAIVEGRSDFRRIASTGFCVLRAGECVIPRYIYYFTQVDEFIAPLVAVSEKAAYPSVTDKIVKNVDIPIPPLAEQKRIVAKIDAAFEKIDALKANAEKNLANAKELFQSALDEAMRPKKGWVEKRLGEVCEGKLSYGTSSPSKGYDARVRYIRITDIDDNGRLLNDLVSPKEYESKHVLEDGDLVFARTGATVGKSYMYSPSNGACVYAGYLIRARVDQSIIRPKYLFYFTKTSRYKLFIQQSQAAAAQPNVNAEKYSNMLVPIPPVHEQDEIVSCIGRAQGLSIQLQQNYAQQIADCAEMRQAILREAFEGRL